MNIHEYQAAELFKKAGIPVGGGKVASEVREAVVIAEELGYPVVLKAQVLTGGRGKAGGIKVVKDKSALETSFTQIKNLKSKGYTVDRIFVVPAIVIKKEFYLAVIIDQIKSDVVLIASAAGGIDIEETAKINPAAIHKFYLQGEKTIDEKRWPAFLKAAFTDSSFHNEVTKISQNLVKLFFQYDCSLAEINPLVIDDKGRMIAADAKVNFDDNALYRQPEIAALRDMKYEDPDELKAKACGLSFVKMDGNVGCIVNGAGLAMATLDIIKLLGGEPANFLDVGGSSNPEKVLNALKIILNNPKVKSILINIFGGITRCDDIANGILQARKELNMSVPIVVRLTGTNEKEARELLAKNGINPYSSMREVVKKAVELAK